MTRYKPNPSIDEQGGLEVHVNAFFARKDLPYTYADFERYLAKGLDKANIARALDVTRQTIANWVKIHEKEQGK